MVNHNFQKSLLTCKNKLYCKTYISLSYSYGANLFQELNQEGANLFQELNQEHSIEQDFEGNLVSRKKREKEKGQDANIG